MKLKVVRKCELFENEIDEMIDELTDKINELKYPKAYPIETMYFFNIGEVTAYRVILERLKGLKEKIRNEI